MSSTINKIALLNGMRTLGFSLIWPYIGLILYKLGLPFWLIGIYYSAQMLVNIVSQVIGGVLTDIMGRVKLMLIGNIGSSMVLILTYLLIRFNTMIVMVLLLAQSLFNSMFAVASSTIVGDLERGLGNLIRAYSRIRVGANAGWAIGPLISGYVMYYLGYSYVFLITALIALASTPLILMLRGLERKVVSFRLIRVNAPFALFLIPTILLFSTMGLLGFALTTYYNVVKHIEISDIGLVYALNGFMVVALQDRVGGFISRRDIRYWLVYGSLIYYISYGVIFMVSNIYEALLDMALVTTGEIIVSPIVQAIAMNMAESDKRGQYMGVFGLASNIGRTMGSVMSSEAMQYMINNPILLWQSLSSPALVASLIYLSLFKVNRRLINMTRQLH
ncbi:MFS transporter [Caldivirga maquilingensis]|uniref:Major facilitator superfamily MFS_1 n=1 Tax=Caldivirga maquilingensis (strain ATCC 700844 / DSM 13496 / JCM 10307 / IC-167) TaxID=397948 RepID=A8MDH1_CALMQ|nr:MFS transporter [Caldivirga maquilingensis]ABW01827.1 major facilitator superfamily MFS_1 [Caldivirga maquilingensis IC-167]